MLVNVRVSLLLFSPSSALLYTSLLTRRSQSSNGTSVAIALPTIGASLHAKAAALQWLVSAYSLSSGCLLLFCGHLADVHGRKRVFVAGSALLAVFTLGCGFVHDEVTLAVLRGLQGIGGAATIPAALGILAHEFPPSSGRARAAAFSSFSAGAPIGGALGMVFGGLVTQLSRYTWRAQFWLSAAIAFAVLVLGIIPKGPDTLPPPRDTRTDWPGAVLSAAGLILLVFVLGQGSGPDILSLLVLSIVLLCIFVLWEFHLETRNRFVASALAYAPPPLLPPSLFARRRGRLGFIYAVALLQFGAFMIWAFWVQLYYQVYIGYSPVRTVIRLVPMFVTGMICNVVVALIVGRVPTLWLIVTGTLTTTVAPLLFALIVPSAPYWAFGFPAAVCSVVGADFLFAAGTIFVADSVAPHEQSVGGGIFQTMTQLGTSFGVTASTIVFNHVQTHWGPRPDALGSYQAAMWTGVGFGGVGTSFALSGSGFF
ncbi:major facilitator superfamily domain-containing protein [Favolaschia claudopus]|uniref:Major facilitator superfamily domain-containing protein n=1 Tax=Favolaschia claudopus TaxID=2862362 RepID=A0AAW0D011_9AGAR